MAKSRHTKTNSQHSQTSSLGFEPSPAIQALVRLWLTDQEAKDIYQQFQKYCIRNCQVLWSGMDRAQAQRWADKRNLQTLTTALGPLLDPSRPDCPYHPKPPSGWVRYIHGASVIFAWYISQGDTVTVLSQPPPQRFHPSGKVYYQTIEEPIIKGEMGNKPVKKIIVVHPTVGGKADDFKYEMWPKDEVCLWIKAFGIRKIVIHWRLVQGEKSSKSPKSQSVGPTTKLPVPNKQKTEPKSVKKGKKKAKKRKKGGEDHDGGESTVGKQGTVVDIRQSTKKKGKKKEKRKKVKAVNERKNWEEGLTKTQSLRRKLFDAVVARG